MLQVEKTVESPKTTIAMQTLLLCSDVQFLGTTRNVLSQLQVTPKVVGSCDDALSLIEEHRFDLIVVDWREIDNLSDFLCTVRRSKLNHECVLVAIVRDLLDLRQAFAAGVHFLIHKPPSAVQIERCLRAAYGATVARRRKQHREPVNLPATAITRTQPSLDVMVANVSESGAGIRLRANRFTEDPQLSVGEEIDLCFSLPESGEPVRATGRVVWTSAERAGIQFSSIPASERLPFESWLTACVERSLTELSERLQAACA